MTDEAYYNDGIAVASGSYSVDIASLSPSTTYYYEAFMMVSDGNGGFKEITSSVGSFTTPAAGTVSSGFLTCYEVPAIGNLSGSGTSGTFTERDDTWYRYYTTNSKQQLATHTYKHPSTNKQVRNYTVLYDGSKYAPLWTAHVMHASMWPDKNVGRNEEWVSDPAINLTQQSGLDNASTVGYSRGHLVASDYRQSSVKQNKQTFYYSNQAPQWQNGFNSGVWSTLEGKVKAAAPSGRDTLYVVTGVLYEGTVKTLSSGSLSVPIPSHFYKCLMKCSFDASGTMTAASGTAFIFTNESHTGEQYNDQRYISTIDAIEQRAGFDFFPNVPSSLQTNAENGTSVLNL